MVRRSTPQRCLADRYFPVRIRVAVPPSGFRSEFDAMCRWLDEHAGSNAYYIGAEAGPALQDAALFYFVDAKMAAAFVEHFSCELVTGRKPPQ